MSAATLRAAAARLAERARNALALVPEDEGGDTRRTALAAVEAVEAALREPSRCQRPRTPANAPECDGEECEGGCAQDDTVCGLPLPCPVHDARHTCRHGRPLDGDCDACEARLGRLVLSAASAVCLCGRRGTRCEECFWQGVRRATDPLSARAGELRAAMRELLTRYLADAGEPETPEPPAAYSRARALCEPCAVCQDNDGDAPRVVHGLVYCSDACAASAGCHCCAGTGWERDGVPCGLCRLDDRADYERQRDDEARGHEDDMRVDEARDREAGP